MCLNEPSLLFMYETHFKINLILCYCEEQKSMNYIFVIKIDTYVKLQWSSVFSFSFQSFHNCNKHF